MRREYPMIRRVAACTAIVAGLLLPAVPALAHEAPDQGEAAWLMADWMLLSFLVFFSVALVVFVVALRRGYLTDLESAKYHILTIDEPDYYTPDWAKEVPDGPDRE